MARRQVNEISFFVAQSRGRKFSPRLGGENLPFASGRGVASVGDIVASGGPGSEVWSEYFDETIRDALGHPLVELATQRGLYFYARGVPNKVLTVEQIAQGEFMLFIDVERHIEIAVLQRIPAREPKIAGPVKLSAFGAGSSFATWR